jgi:leucyl-tRNA synthetase
MAKYNPKKIEAKWAKIWAKNLEFSTASDVSRKEKKYILDMFPYPSAEGLHIGHVESYTATDILSRYLRMNGKNVLHPTGWDAFGLPAENYAVKVKTHPAVTTQRAIKNYKRQMKMMGFSYDWSREVDSTDPDYYKWTQWFFLLLYKNGLAYRGKAKVNWCNFCKTVLANEQVENGKCERCKNTVVQKDLEQWFFKITDFIEDKESTTGLISGLSKIDWPESTKSSQLNWIGKSEGAIIDFKVRSGKIQTNEVIKVFTTRLDTIFGCTYCVIAPENPLVSSLKHQLSNAEEVEKYTEESKHKSDLERMEDKDKTGVEMEGIMAVNPFTNEAVPIFVADYVLSHYGTGAVMAVPAHDTRDMEFAFKYHLPIKEVIESIDKELTQNSKIKIQNDNSKLKNKNCFVEDGMLFNSGEYTGVTSEKARKGMIRWLENNNLGKRKVNYKIRDWLVSRQRYWGAPIPIIYCEKCGTVPVPEKNLPVKLPGDVDFKPTGESPLKYSKKFQNVNCPVCGGKARRESDTMDTFVCSSWYFFRYSDPRNNKEFASKKSLKRWMPVDLYVGGAEHSVLHLLYSRFFTKVLHNLSYIDFDEPFLKLRHQGIILGPDGQKMSKSRGNVINPDDEAKKWSADTLRLFEMFLGPLEDMKPWNTQGIVGVYRFLEKIWKLQGKLKTKKSPYKADQPRAEKLKITTQSLKLEISINKTIKKVSEDIENLRFNTAISSLMILTNELEKEEFITTTNYQSLISLLSPFAPFICEELWSRLGYKESIFKELWPKYNKKLIRDEEIDFIVQVNGKVRDKIRVNADISEDQAKEISLTSEKIKSYIGNRKIKKVIFVKGRLVNFVV